MGSELTRLALGGWGSGLHKRPELLPQLVVKAIDSSLLRSECGRRNSWAGLAPKHGGKSSAQSHFLPDKELSTDVCEVRSEFVWDLALQQALLKVRVHGSIKVSLSVPEGPAGNVTLQHGMCLLSSCLSVVGMCHRRVPGRPRWWVCVGLAWLVVSSVGLPPAFLRQVLATCSPSTSRRHWSKQWGPARCPSWLAGMGR